MCFAQFFCLDKTNTDAIDINKPCKLNFTFLYNGLSYEFAAVLRMLRIGRVLRIGSVLRILRIGRVTTVTSRVLNIYISLIFIS